MTRVYVELNGVRAYGTVVARREKTRQIYVVVDDNPKVDGWHPVTLWKVDE